jgi:hypothetical protein
MSVYFYGEQQIESMVRATRRFRLFFCAFSISILVAACGVAFLRPEWIFGVHQHARLWVIAALTIFVAGPLLDNLWRWRSRLAAMQESLQRTVIEVSEEAVRVERASGMRQLSRSDIQRAEEVSWGLYLRTANRYCWLMVPAQIDGFESLKREIEEMGIPIVRAAVPPNWEEPAGVVVCGATILCAIFTRSTGVLAVNLGISLLVAVAGFLVVSANPDNLPKMRWARFGIFLPAAMTASMLWMALQR